jgi:hypothetical protein
MAVDLVGATEASGTGTELSDSSLNWWRGPLFGVVGGALTFLGAAFEGSLSQWQLGLLGLAVFLLTWGAEQIILNGRNRRLGVGFLVFGVVTFVLVWVDLPPGRGDVVLIPDPTVDPAETSRTVAPSAAPSPSTATTDSSVVASATPSADGGAPTPSVDDPADQGQEGTPGTTTTTPDPPAVEDVSDGQQGVQPAPVHGAVFDNYGAAVQPGIPMCLGNPGRPESLPGGVVTQTFAVPAGATSVDRAMVQIDPNGGATATATLSGPSGSTTATATPVGDTVFTFSPLSVSGGSQVTLTITFSSTHGKLITVYKTGGPGGSFRVDNSCSDGAPTVDLTPYGLRATVSGWFG